jgi:flagellar biosynthesis protein FlhG
MGNQAEKSPSFGIVRTTATERPVSARPHTRSIAIVSGKGGVGKTTLATNLAIALQRQGRKVLVVDGDLGMANVDLLLGLVPRYTLHDVVTGERTPEEILIRTEDGIHLMPGASGIEEMANLDDLRCERLLRSVAHVEGGMDLILIDTAPGIHRSTTHLARAADEVVVVTTPEPTSWADAYATLRVLTRKGPRGRQRDPWLVVNQARDAYEARATMARIRETSLRFLSIEPQFLGYVLEDPAVGSAVRRQEPVMRLFPSSPAASCIELLAQRLMTSPDPEGHLAPSPSGGTEFRDRDPFVCGHRARA